MSTLSNLKDAAATKLAAAEAEVKNYVAGLEAKVSTNKYWVGGGGIVGAVLGWLLHIHKG